MGVFDYITFEAGIPGCPFNRFQTKDLDAQWLDEYFVTAEGFLEHEAYELESVPQEERPYPNAEPDSLLAFCGSLKRANVRRERESFTGAVEFYGTGFDGLRAISLTDAPSAEWDTEAGTMVPAREREWLEYCAEFEQGKLVGGPVRLGADEGLS